MSRSIWSQPASADPVTGIWTRHSGTPPFDITGLQNGVPRRFDEGADGPGGGPRLITPGGLYLFETDFSDLTDAATAALVDGLRAGRATGTAAVNWYSETRLTGEVGPGCVIGRKSGNFAGMTAWLAVPAGTYRLRAQMALATQAITGTTTGDWKRNSALSIPGLGFGKSLTSGGARTGLGTGSSAGFTQITGTLPGVLEVDVTVAIDQPFVTIQATNNTSTGGTAGGNANLTYLLVQQLT